MSWIKNLVGTGTVTGREAQWLHIKTATGHTNDRIRRVHNYGFISRPLVVSNCYNQTPGIRLTVESQTDDYRSILESSVW